jgi:hypothetical protein
MLRNIAMLERDRISNGGVNPSLFSFVGFNSDSQHGISASSL